ncbi:formyltransferase family protein [Leptospira meyeri]|uniref:formyltransferase family protein n=1 Tax=Leptospira meyeri TaxID=29508 RepID=UPI001AEF6EE3
MIVSIVSDESSWINSRIGKFISDIQARNHIVKLFHNHEDLPKGDVCFIVSYSKIIPKFFLQFHSNNIVVHESELPKGKGWSPMTWQIVEGKSSIPFTLFEASSEGVDAGVVYIRDSLFLSGSELVDEWRDKQADKTFEMCLRFLEHYRYYLEHFETQSGEDSFYKKRTPVDSELNINSSILDQFNLLRVVDNEKYPAYFVKDGKKYIIKIFNG